MGFMSASLLLLVVMRYGGFGPRLVLLAKRLCLSIICMDAPITNL